MHHFVPCSFVAIVTLSAVLVSLSRHGVAIQLASVAFVGSLTLTQLLVKELSSEPYLFRFPGYLTVAHLTTCWAFAAAYWAARGDLGRCSPRSVGSLRLYFLRVLPIACTLPVAVIANNMALLYIAAGLNAIIGSLSPATTALLSALMGRQLARESCFGLLVAVAGAVILSLEEARAGFENAGGFAAIGISLGFVAVAFRSLKTVLQDRLMNAREYDKSGELSMLRDKEPKCSVAPLHLWALQAPPMVLVALLYAVCTESFAEASRRLTPQVAGVAALSCASATALNLLGTVTLKALGASLMQAIGKLSVILTVSFSVFVMEEKLPLRALAGAGIMLVGILIIERAESRRQQLSEKGQL